MKRITLSLCFFCALFFAVQARGQATEERFHDLFVTAGYATAFGAALGAAFLSFTPDPASELRYVAVGASLGFIGGSVLGSYIIFSPMISFNQDQGERENSRLLAEGVRPAPQKKDLRLTNFGDPSADRKLIVKPVYNVATRQLTAVEGTITLLRF